MATPTTPDLAGAAEAAAESTARAGRRVARGVAQAGRDSASVLEREWADLKADFEDLVSNPAVRDMPEVRALKERLQESLHRAGEAVADVTHDISRKVRDTASIADEYAHDQPWKVAALAGLAGLVVGLLISRR
jgi:ElaB/YqjD/DUF883 family membrane-anchored ribosome-binding protein